MRYLRLSEALYLHERILERSGGSPGIRDMNALESAISQPRATFDGDDLYASLVEKAAAIGYSLVLNHPFVDGNKRIGHAALEVTLLLNGLELQAPVDEQEALFLSLAAGTTTRDELVSWLKAHVTSKRSEPG